MVAACILFLFKRIIDTIIVLLFVYLKLKVCIQSCSFDIFLHKDNLNHVYCIRICTQAMCYVSVYADFLCELCE